MTGLAQFMRGCRLAQWQLFFDNDPQFAGVDQSGDFLQPDPVDVATLESGGNAMLLRQRIVRRRRNGQQQATLADHGVGIFQRLTAHIIQHEVDILDLGGKILTAIVDDFIGAEGFDERDVRGGTRGNNIQAGKLGELNGKSADAAGAGMNKHPLTRRGPGGVE